MSRPSHNPTLTLPRGLATDVLDAARRGDRFEICGFIALGQTAWYRYAIANNASRAEDRFDMDAVEHIAAFKHIREHRLTLVAIYHSHPLGEAKPSIHDIRGHSYPRAACVIVAPRARIGATIRAWHMHGGEPIERAIAMIDAPWRNGFL